MESGIYSIVNKLDGKRYVGSSKALQIRWLHGHVSQLKNGTHFNRHLQSAWNRDGEDAFDFVVLENCSIEVFVEKESFWIEHFQSWNRKFGYNLDRILDGLVVRSDETIELQRSREFDNDVKTLVEAGWNKSQVARHLKLNRGQVYSSLHRLGIHERKRCSPKLDDAKRAEIKQLRDKGNSWDEIFRIAGISKTHAYRMGVVTKDGKCFGKTAREKYRPVTDEMLDEVRRLRKQGKTWDEVSKAVGVNTATLFRNGVAAEVPGRAKEVKPRLSITEEIRHRIFSLSDEGLTATEISRETGIAPSTVRLQLKKRVQ